MVFLLRDFSFALFGLTFRFQPFVFFSGVISYVVSTISILTPEAWERSWKSAGAVWCFEGFPLEFCYTRGSTNIAGWKMDRDWRCISYWTCWCSIAFVNLPEVRFYSDLRKIRKVFMFGCSEMTWPGYNSQDCAESYAIAEHIDSTTEFCQTLGFQFCNQSFSPKKNWMR